jgi:hypothetical protein
MGRVRRAGAAAGGGFPWASGAARGAVGAAGSASGFSVALPVGLGRVAVAVVPVSGWGFRVCHAVCEVTFRELLTFHIKIAETWRKSRDIAVKADNPT